MHRRLIASAAAAAAAITLAGCVAEPGSSDNDSYSCDAACEAELSSADYGTDAPAVPDTDITDDSELTEEPLPDYTDEPEIDTPETVTFRVTGNGERAATITYYVDGSIRQKTNVRLPWKKTIEVDEPSFSGFNMNAQNLDGTKIKCSIAVDGEVLQRATSTGPYSVVSCATEDPNYVN